MKPIVYLIVCTALSLAGGCVDANRPWTRTELYFGQSQAEGQTISPEQWEQFVAQIVTPRFPEGLTVLEGAGQWRNARGELLREQSKVLVIVRPTSLAGQQKVDEIRQQYKERFGQESVLVVESAAAVRF